MLDSSPDAAAALDPRIAPTDGSHLVDLVEQITKGRAKSLTRLHQLTVKPLYLIAHSILRSTMDAEEIVCDTFLYAWQNAHRYDPARGSVIAWLALIVRHRSIDLLRKRRWHDSLENDDVKRHVATIPCGTESPEGIMAQAQTIRKLHIALAELPILRRRLVELAFFDHLTHQEISVVVGIPAGTVKSHIRRALCKMRAAIKRHEKTGVRKSAFRRTLPPAAVRGRTRNISQVSSRFAPATSRGGSRPGARKGTDIAPGAVSVL